MHIEPQAIKKSKNAFPQQQKSVSQGLPHSPHSPAPPLLPLGIMPRSRRVTLTWERFNVWWAVEFWETVLRFLGIWFWNSLRDCSEICSEMVLGLSETVLRFIHHRRYLISSRNPASVSEFLFLLRGDLRDCSELQGLEPFRISIEASKVQPSSNQQRQPTHCKQTLGGLVDGRSVLYGFVGCVGCCWAELV